MGCQVLPPLTVLKIPPAAVPDVDDAWIGFHHGEIVDASAHGGGADVAELQVLQDGVVRGLRDGAGGQQGK